MNLAARFENRADAMEVICCARTYDLIKDRFQCTLRGSPEMKGFGTRDVYTIEQEFSDRR